MLEYFLKTQVISPGLDGFAREFRCWIYSGLAPLRHGIHYRKPSVFLPKTVNILSRQFDQEEGIKLYLTLKQVNLGLSIKDWVWLTFKCYVSADILQDLCTCLSFSGQFFSYVLKRITNKKALHFLKTTVLGDDKHQSILRFQERYLCCMRWRKDLCHVHEVLWFTSLLIGWIKHIVCVIHTLEMFDQFCSQRSDCKWSHGPSGEFIQNFLLGRTSANIQAGSSRTSSGLPQGGLKTPRWLPLSFVSSHKHQPCVYGVVTFMGSLFKLCYTVVWVCV